MTAKWVPKHKAAARRKAYNVARFYRIYPHASLQFAANFFHKSATWVRNYKIQAQELGLIPKRRRRNP